MEATPADQFSDTFDLMLTDISYIIYELNLDGLCSSINSSAVDIAKSILWKHDMTSVMNSISDLSDEIWLKAERKDPRFVTDDLCNVLRRNSAPIDTDILCVVFMYHEKICNSAKWEQVPDDERPISADDINKLWDHIFNLLSSVDRMKMK